MSKTFANEKGSVTLFVVVAMLFFMLFLLTMYMNLSNKIMNKNEEIAKIQKNYEDKSMDEEYERIMNEDDNTDDGDVTIPIDIEIGDRVKYTPSGIYNWEIKYSGSSSNVKLDSSTDDYKIERWRVFDINEKTGEVTLVPEAPTSEGVYLGNAQGYNNAVYLLNEACNSLYGNSSKEIKARNMNIDDIEGKMTTQALAEAHNYESNGVKYGEQIIVAYNKIRSFYPIIYAKEELSVINGNKNETGLKMSEQDRLILSNEEGAISGYLQPTTNIQPYQTSWRMNGTSMTTTFISAENGVNYYELIMPQGTGTNYWLSSRNVDCAVGGFCYYNVGYVFEGGVDVWPMFRSQYQTNGTTKSLFPVVSLSIGLIEESETEGYVVK